MPKRVAIVGSRDFPHMEMVEEYVRTLPEGTIVVSGGARGVDTVAVRAARRRGLEVVVHRPNWQRLGKKAGIVRNAVIVQEADFIAAFWDGKSPGTFDTIKRAKVANKGYTVFYA